MEKQQKELLEHYDKGKKISCPRGCPYRGAETDMNNSLCNHNERTSKYCDGWWEFPAYCPLEEKS